MASGTSGNITWNLDESTGVLTLSGTGAMNDYKSSFTVAPWATTSYGYKIKSVIINEGVTSIGNYAFYQVTNMTSIVIPNSVTSIGDYAFYDCMYLTSIEIPDSVTSIGEWAFYACVFTSLVIPDSVTSMGKNAFYNGKFTSLVIGDGITSIEIQTFANCKSLTSVVIGKGVTSIGQYAFQNCFGLTSITFLGSSAPTLSSYSFSLGSSSIPVTATVYTKGGWGSDSVFTSSVRQSYTTFIYEKLVTANVHINVSGTWKESTPYVNVNGTWKEVVGVYVNVNGTWKEAV